ncbi:MAG TPA: enoyl-CoA hydratase/isomerase family protein, partial [Paracoccaceae bacterium]|nr:enoyl-CoA hydratase/isomerase family protein [Paracoccaceae bacterium]
MDYSTLKVETADDVMVVTLNRPEVLNAMNTAMMRDLRTLFTDLYVDPDQARAVILTGAGERGFCPGADLKERDGMTDAVWRRQHAVVEQFIRAMFVCPVPLIAAVNGVAMGGGAEIALACDFIYAADHARFAFPEVTRGIMPGAAGPQNLPRAVGVRRAKEIVLTGRPFSAR